MPITVLFVDDNEDIRNNVNELLTLSGYNVLLAANGKEGLEQAKNHLPDIIICDVMMPDLDGWSVLHILKKDVRTRNIPFIFLTAKTERIDFRTAIELGASDYITKPFETSDLLNSIESVLKRTVAHKEKIAVTMSEHTGITLPDSKDPLADLIRQSDVREYKKKEVLYKEGSMPRYLYYVKSGKIKTYRIHEDGKELVIDLYGPGDFLGYLSLMQNSFNNETAKVIDDTEVVMIPKREFDMLMDKNVEVIKRFNTLVTKNLMEREKKLLDIAYNSLRKKVARALLVLENKYHHGDVENFAIDIPRDDLAAIAGTATESLVRTLTDFKSEQLIDIQSGTITILNKHKLENLLS